MAQVLDDPLVRGFFASFAVTGVALAAALVLGRRRRLRGHLAAVIAFLLLFLVTVGFAEAVGRRYDFDRTARGVHLPIAISASVAALAPVITGFRRWRDSGSLGAHRAAIGVFLALFVLATSTGVYMLTTATPK